MHVHACWYNEPTHGYWKLSKRFVETGDPVGKPSKVSGEGNIYCTLGIRSFGMFSTVHHDSTGSTLSSALCMLLTVCHYRITGISGDSLIAGIMPVQPEALEVTSLEHPWTSRRSFGECWALMSALCQVLSVQPAHQTHCQHPLLWVVLAGEGCVEVCCHWQHFLFGPKWCTEKSLGLSFFLH